ncbi:MAG TPA: ParB/RepB/Spo0J family partition protein [Candidatus Eremiobacteraeota bacterium]|nr:MAG: Chromosome-partitioning protein Spo0J [bacterium ADurb.Bin363]HPZ06919.1 ParB/RepB/Spo0J family partition protein [Candidatus Eremiobacteraeota bacterium]
MVKKGLGKGLRAIFSQVDMTSTEEETIVQLKIDEIKPNPYQPRKNFDEEELQELSLSIKEHGLIQPVVTIKEGDTYYLVVGERRWRASKKAGLSKIPAVIKKKEDINFLLMALVENLQRSDLNPVEEAEALGQLSEEFELTQEEIASRVGKNRSTVANILRLLNLPGEIKESLRKGLISSGHARAILMIEKQEEQVIFCKKIIREGLSVRQAEELAKIKEEIVKKPFFRVNKPSQILDLEENLQKLFGTRVEIKQNKKENKGKIEIAFYSLEDLNRLLDIILSSREKSLEDIL